MYKMTLPLEEYRAIFRLGVAVSELSAICGRSPAAAFGQCDLRTTSSTVMQEQFVEVYLGAHTADAERVEIAFSNGNLQVRYLDWQEQPRGLVMPQTLAFRWQDDEDGSAPRDDTTYEVTGST